MNFFKLSGNELDLVKRTEEERFANTQKGAKIIFIFFNIPVAIIILTGLPSIFSGGFMYLLQCIPMLIFLELFVSIMPGIIYFTAKNKLKKVDENLYGIYGILKSKEVKTELYRSNGKTRRRTVYWFHIEIDGMVDSFRVYKDTFNNKTEGDKILVVNFHPDKPLVPFNCQCY